MRVRVRCGLPIHRRDEQVLEHLAQDVHLLALAEEHVVERRQCRDVRWGGQEAVRGTDFDRSVKFRRVRSALNTRGAIAYGQWGKMSG